MGHINMPPAASHREARWFHRYKLFVVGLFVIYGMIQKVSVFERITTSHILPAAMLGTAAVCILWDFLRIHTLFKNKYTWIFVGFIGSTAISALLTLQYGVYTNIVMICYLAAEILLMYQFDADRGKEQLYREFKIICFIVSIISFFFSLFSLFSYFAYLDYEFVDGVGTVISQGYSSTYHRVWGVYYETNYQGLMDIVVMFISLLLFSRTKYGFAKVFFVVNFVIHFACLVLTSSRSCVIALYTALFIFGFFVCKNWMKLFWKVPVKLLVRLLSGGVLVALAAVAFYGVKSVMPYAQMTIANKVSLEFRVKTVELIQQVYAYNGIEIRGQFVDYEWTPTGNEPSGAPGNRPFDEEPLIQNPEAITRPDLSAKEDYSNGRLPVWIDGFRLFTQYPIFGMSPGNRAEIVNQNNLEVSQEIKEGHTLINGYLEVLVGSGVVGALALAAFLIACLRRLLQYDRLYGKNRFDIGCVLAVVTASLVFALFLSELFYMRSLFTYLFWITLGYAMALIDVEEKENAPDQDFAFMCDTPLQVLNAVSFVESNTEDCKGRSDLFLYHQFRDSETLSARIKESGVFRCVYDFSKIPEQTGVRGKLATSARLLFPNYTLKKLCHGNTDYANHHYGTIALSFYTPFSDVLRLATGTPRAIQFEDGLGSYVTPDLESSYRTGLFAFINRYLVNDALSYHAQALYLNNPALCAYSVLTVKKLTGMADDTHIADTIKQMYGFKSSLYANHRIVYLTQPFGPSEGGDSVVNAEQHILPILKKSHPVVRVHPRQSVDAFEGFELDMVGNMWEVECGESIGDDHVLIGAFSTAQLTPKIMFDREPTLVFLYKLYGCRFNNADELVERARASYRNPQKILVPETEEEFKTILKTL